MKYEIIDGVAKLDFELSRLERQILNLCCNTLEESGYEYLSIPSTITPISFYRQDVPVGTFGYSQQDYLAGSAEQGILQYFADSKIDKKRKIFSQNTCFRLEDKYFDLRKLKEFTKVEQFIFCEEKDWEEYFDDCLNNAIYVLEQYGLEYRIVDMTTTDPGYHIHKKDIEVMTKRYGWMETHSCAYFADEQSKRFDITGVNHTISCTGVASPRILIPIMERK